MLRRGKFRRRAVPVTNLLGTCSHKLADVGVGVCGKAKQHSVLAPRILQRCQRFCKASTVVKASRKKVNFSAGQSECLMCIGALFNSAALWPCMKLQKPHAAALERTKDLLVIRLQIALDVQPFKVWRQLEHRGLERPADLHIMTHDC